MIQWQGSNGSWTLLAGSPPAWPRSCKCRRSIHGRCMLSVACKVKRWLRMQELNLRDGLMRPCWDHSSLIRKSSGGPDRNCPGIPRLQGGRSPD